MKKVIIITITLVCLWCMPTYAELTVEVYEKHKDDPMVTMYIAGVGHGIEWANVVAGGKIYCIPGKLALEVSNYTRILDDAIKDMRKIGAVIPDTPIGLYLIDGLQKTFPCTK